MKTQALYFHLDVKFAWKKMRGSLTIAQNGKVVESKILEK